MLHNHILWRYQILKTTPTMKTYDSFVCYSCHHKRDHFLTPSHLLKCQFYKFWEDISHLVATFYLHQWVEWKVLDRGFGLQPNPDRNFPVTIIILPLEGHFPSGYLQIPLGYPCCNFCTRYHRISPNKTKISAQLLLKAFSVGLFSKSSVVKGSAPWSINTSDAASQPSLAAENKGVWPYMRGVKCKG